MSMMFPNDMTSSFSSFGGGYNQGSGPPPILMNQVNWGNLYPNASMNQSLWMNNSYGQQFGGNNQGFGPQPITMNQVNWGNLYPNTSMNQSLYGQQSGFYGNQSIAVGEPYPQSNYYPSFQPNFYAMPYPTWMDASRFSNQNFGSGNKVNVFNFNLNSIRDNTITYAPPTPAPAPAPSPSGGGSGGASGGKVKTKSTKKKTSPAPAPKPYAPPPNGSFYGKGRLMNGG